MYVLDLVVKCSVPDDVDKYDFPGVPLRTGCYPRFQFNGECYLCKIMHDEGPIKAGDSGVLTLRVSSPHEISVCCDDAFQLVTSPAEENMTVLAQGKVLESVMDDLEL